MAKYIETEKIKRKLGERIAQQCYTASSVQEFNEAWPKPNKISSQFQDDRQFATDRVRTQYVDELRESFYINEHYDPALTEREQELDKKRQSLLERKTREDERKRAERIKEMELDLKRQELLKMKTEHKKSNKKRRKKEKSDIHVDQEANVSINSPVSNALLTEDVNKKNVGMGVFVPAPPCIVKPAAKESHLKKDIDATPHELEKGVIRKIDVKEDVFKKALDKNNDVQEYQNQVNRKVYVKEDGLKKAFNKCPDMGEHTNDLMQKSVVYACNIKKYDNKIYATQNEVKSDVVTKTNAQGYDTNVVKESTVDTSENDAAPPVCGNPDWGPESMVQRIRRLNLKYLMGQNGTNTEPAPPKCDKPETTSYTNTEPAPPKCDKPETASYNRARGYEFISSGHTKDFVNNSNYVPTPPVCKPKDDCVSVAKKPAVMSWNATTAKMKVGFKSKLRREQDQASGDKT
ncbi:hypothetical protein DPMN_095915 [Dreissena polymorpha]|uniref:Uncharacterized protein n=2 Tax=Dreissena polymorpha TaxID=45954 RepID=A0A9D4LA81_DREPO|nr:hypothetical protein DPMN_095915 [Dreissena polymorpha]